jgi:hypothetical protein
MITISTHVQRWVDQHPLCADMIAAGIINHSALARRIRPEIQAVSGQSVSNAAITVALNRQSKILAKTRNAHDYRRYIGDISIQTGLSIVVVAAEADVPVYKAKHISDYFVISQGLWHSTIIAKTDVVNKLHLKPAHIKQQMDKLTGLTVRLGEGNIAVPGVIAHALQILAAKQINLLEVISAHNELTVILDEDQAQKALKALLDHKAAGKSMYSVH